MTVDEAGEGQGRKEGGRRKELGRRAEGETPAVAKQDTRRDHPKRLPSDI